MKDIQKVGETVSRVRCFVKTARDAQMVAKRII